MPNRNDVIRWVAVGTTAGLMALMRVGWAVLKAKKKAQRAERRFRRQLVSGGMDEETARRLSESYIESVRVRKILSAAIRGRGQRTRP